MTTTEQDDYDRHMNEMTARIGRAVEGEDVSEIAFACCGVIGFCVHALPADERPVLRKQVLEFLNDVLERDHAN